MRRSNGPAACISNLANPADRYGKAMGQFLEVRFAGAVEEDG